MGFNPFVHSLVDPRPAKNLKIFLVKSINHVHFEIWRFPKGKLQFWAWTGFKIGN